jgi:hypothetical protein
MGGEKMFRDLKPEDLEVLYKEVALAKALIKERASRFDLVRELVSNSAAKEVGASEIRVSYFMSPEGHSFMVEDDGCGMGVSDDFRNPDRLDKFFGLGLSQIAGLKSDEFGFKGLGSKLAYQSRRLEVETFAGGSEMYRVVVNEPWKTIDELNTMPNPKRYTDKPDEGQETFTKVTVIGHPPPATGQPYPKEALRNYLLHRTFVGFTRDRENPPRFFFSYMGQEEELEVGFPELEYLHEEPKPDTVLLDIPLISRNLSGKTRGVNIRIRGFYTWDEKRYGLASDRFNTGLILSVKGIPYFNMNMRELSRVLAIARPGEGKCCIIVECDELQEVMNISRSGLVDDPITELFKNTLKNKIVDIEVADEQKQFFQFSKDKTITKTAEDLAKVKEDLSKAEQGYVVYKGEEGPILLGVEPISEGDVITLLLKLETLGVLPFFQFQSLHQEKNGPDFIGHFRETDRSEPLRYTVFEMERIFTNYQLHGHPPDQHRKVICWDLGKSPKVRIKDVPDVPYKKVAHVDYEVEGVKKSTEVWVYLIRYMPNIEVMMRQDLERIKNLKGVI